MIEAVQSNFVTLVAGALLASCLVAVGALENAQAEDASIVSALDSLALQVARADCSPRHPQTTIDLAATLSHLHQSVVAVDLLPDHLRARSERGASFASVEFPPLPVATQVALLGRLHLTLSFDFLTERCAASAS